MAIVHCAGHNDPLLIESIWTNIIQQELDSMRNVISNDDKMNRLLGKISTLGKEYVSSGCHFPLCKKHLIIHFDLLCEYSNKEFVISSIYFETVGITKL